MPLLEGFEGILALIDTDLSLEDNRIESLRIEQASALRHFDTSTLDFINQGIKASGVTYVPVFLSRFRGYISEIVLERRRRSPKVTTLLLARQTK